MGPKVETPVIIQIQAIMTGTIIEDVMKDRRGTQVIDQRKENIQVMTIIMIVEMAITGVREKDTIRVVVVVVEVEAEKGILISRAQDGMKVDLNIIQEMKRIVMKRLVMKVK